MPRINADLPAHWSSDFVQHIRTVNFALIAVCMALIGIVQFDKPADVTVAASQLKEIKAVIDNWQSLDIRDSFLKSAAATAGVRSEPTPNTEAACDYEGKAVRITLDPEPMLSLPGIDGQYIGDSHWHGLAYIAPDYSNSNHWRRAPRTLTEFRSFWNALHQRPLMIVPDVKSLQDKALYVAPDGKSAVLGCKYAGTVDFFLRDEFDIDNFPFGAVATTNEAAKLLTAANLPLTSYMLKGGPMSSVLPKNPEREYLVKTIDYVGTTFFPLASCKTVSLDVDVLVRAHQGWTGREFSTAFSELEKATAGIQDRSFETIAVGFEDELARSKTTEFEILGVKVPVEKATQWGIFLIVAVQFYLWVHLHELSPRLGADDPGWDVAWIGFYRSPPARGLFTLSTLILPPLTIGVLGRHAIVTGRAPGVWAVYSLMLCLSFLISMLTMKSAPRRQIRGAAAAAKMKNV